MVCALKSSNFLYETNKRGQTEENKAAFIGEGRHVRTIDNSECLKQVSNNLLFDAFCVSKTDNGNMSKKDSGEQWE